MKCPIESCKWERQKPLPGFTEKEMLLYHLSAVARDAHKLEPHEILLRKLKNE